MHFFSNLLQRFFNSSPVEAPARSSNPTDISRMLLDAADRIETRGWCQGPASDAEGRVCLMGAIYNVAPNTNKVGNPWLKAEAEAAANVMISYGYGGMWNDAPGRTKAEVLSALRRVAATQGA